MKSIAKLYLAYVETAVISILLATLVLISVSGFIYGGKGWLPGALAVLILCCILYVSLDRHSALKESPELRGRLFAETRLFLLILQRKMLRMTRSFFRSSRRQAMQQVLSRIGPIIIVALTMWTLWSSFSISADIQKVKKNQAIVAAGPGIPATVFNRAIVIEIIQISMGTPPRVTAVIHADGYPDAKIENAPVGYETIYVGPDRFSIRVQKINNLSAEFFVERIVDYR